MPTIQLTQGKVAVVDEADYEELARFKWYAMNNGRTWYAVRCIRRSGGRHRIFMHRALLAVLPGMHVDHIDGDGLNNTRANLRIATHGENTRNQRLRTNNTSGYKGVSWHKGHGKWTARIGANGKTHLGDFDTAEEAAAAYDAAALELYGEFARTNAMLSAGDAASGVVIVAYVPDRIVKTVFVTGSE